MSNTTILADVSQDNLTATPKKISRDELERMSSELVRILHRRTTAHRFKPSQHDASRLAYARATIAALQVYGGILKDTEISTLDGRISELERQREGRNRL